MLAKIGLVAVLVVSYFAFWAICLVAAIIDQPQEMARQE